MIIKSEISTLGKSLRFIPISLFMLIVFWSMIPLGADQVFEYPSLEGEAFWDLGNDRIVSMTHHQPADSIERQEAAILFLHGGPGAFVRDFDRDFWRVLLITVTRFLCMTRLVLAVQLL